MQIEEVEQRLAEYSGLASSELRDLKIIKKDEHLHTLASYLGIPIAYARKCPRSVLMPQIFHFFSNVSHNPVYFYHKEGEIHSLSLRPSCYTDSLALFQAIRRKVPVEKVDYFHANGHITCSVVTEKGTQVQVGDVVNFGVSFSVYPAGQAFPEIDSYIYRLSCSNGAVSAINVFKSNKNTMSNIVTWAETAAEEAFKKAEQEVDLLKQLVDIRLDGDISKLVKHLISKVYVPLLARKVLLERVKVENPQTMYDLWNIITTIGTQFGMLAQGELIKRAAGRLLQHSKVCESCRRPL